MRRPRAKHRQDGQQENLSLPRLGSSVTMLDSTLAAAVNSLAKQLRNIDKSIRQQSKRIETIKDDLQETRLRKEKTEKAIEKEIESVLRLRFGKFIPINTKQRSAQSLIQHAARKTNEASTKFQEASESLASTFRTFEERTTEHHKSLNKDALRAMLQQAQEVGLDYEEKFDQLAQTEEKTRKEQDNLKRRAQVCNLQTQMLGEQMRHLEQAKSRLVEEESKVETELSNIEAKHHDSWNEHIVAADILSLQHSKTELQQSIDFLVAQRMVEQGEVAKLKEKLQWSNQQVQRNVGAGNAHKLVTGTNGSHNKPSFVTARKMIVEQHASQALSSKAKRKQKQKTTTSNSISKRKAQTQTAGGCSHRSSETQHVDVFGGRKYNH